MESLKPLVRVIDDDDAMRRSWAFLIEGEGWDVAVYSDALDFISSGDFQRPGCLVLDVRMPRMSGLELQDKMRELGIDLPIIFISGHGDIDMAVRTLKLGAVDFLQKPVDDQRLLTAIGSAVMNNLNHRRTEMELSSFRSRLMQLTQREREVIRMVAHGMSNKQVAENLGISEKTKNKILAAAEELGYIPNDLARTLVSGRSRNIGLLLPSNRSAMSQELISACSRLFVDNGYLVISESSEGDEKREREILNRFLIRRVDCIIISWVGEESNADLR